jgi:hypothetical protein
MCSGRATSSASQNDWRRRLRVSVGYALLAVFVSTIAVIGLSSLQNPTVQPNGTTAIDISTDVLGLPLATGWLFVSAVFGEWRAVHQGQIALVPFVSVAIDSLLIFLVWEFLHRKKSRGLGSDSILHLGR